MSSSTQFSLSRNHPGDEEISGRPPARRRSAHRGVPELRNRQNRLAFLDGLRFLAALSVVLFHLAGHVPAGFRPIWGAEPAEILPAAVHQLFGFGRLGVDLFFLISGFVIAMSGWGRSPRDFFISRVTRLYPMYWISIAVTVLLLSVHQSGIDLPPVRQIVANLTMMQTALGVDDLEPVYWTLWPELMFYVLFGVVVWKGCTYQRIVLFCGFWILATVIAPATGERWVTLIVNPTYSPYFIAGMAFHLMHRFRPTPILWGIVSASWMLAVTSITDPANIKFRWGAQHPEPLILVTAVTVFYALMTVVALGWTSGIRWAWLTRLGALTYPLYLLHNTLGVKLIQHGRDHIGTWPLLALVVLALTMFAYLLHRFVEKPAAGWLRKRMKAGSFSLQR